MSYIYSLPDVTEI